MPGVRIGFEPLNRAWSWIEWPWPDLAGPIYAGFPISGVLCRPRFCPLPGLGFCHVPFAFAKALWNSAI